MATAEHPTSSPGGPTWEIAHLFPNQGTWTVDDYLALNTNHLVEFSDGVLEVLPMPTERHQLIVLFLYRALFAFVAPAKLGTVLTAPLRVKLWESKFREPDVVFMLARHTQRRGEKYWQGADLVMEVVGEDDPDRDLVTKRAEYAQAGIGEYWIVNPSDATVTVLALNSTTGGYDEAGNYATADTARSLLLVGFCVAVDDLFGHD
jgi:Uma2 family endonuclease